MPAPYGIFNKQTLDHKQPNTKALNYFVLQMVTDAIATSSLQSISSAKAFLWLQHPNFQQLKNVNPNFTTLITVVEDQATRELYPQNWRDKGEAVPFWFWAIQINTTIEASPQNSILIMDLKDEMINLLTKNATNYTNSINQGGVSKVYSNLSTLNILTEDLILQEGENNNKPNYLTSSLTIVFKITLGTI